MLTKVLVPVDLSPLSRQAARKAASIARSTDAIMHLVHVYESPFPPFDGGYVLTADFLAVDRARFEQQLRGIADDLIAQFGCRVETAMLAGPPAEAIVKYAREKAVDLIVMSTHGRTGFSRAWFGSVADALSRQSIVPVLMVRTPDQEPAAPPEVADPPFRRVLLALDGSERAERAVACVEEMPQLKVAEILLAQIVAPVPLPPVTFADVGLAMSMGQDVDATNTVRSVAEGYLAGVVRRLERNGARKVTMNVLVAPNTGAAIIGIAHTWGADLVAITSHGRGASRLLIGSVADKILRGTSGSVLLASAKG